MVVLGESNNLFYCLIFLRGHPLLLLEGEEEGLKDGVTVTKCSKTKRIQRYTRPCIATDPKSKGNGRIIASPSDRDEPFCVLVFESDVGGRSMQCFNLDRGVEVRKTVLSVDDCWNIND